MIPSPETLLGAIEASGLRGRGGAWFPTFRKWRAVRVEGGSPLVIANGAEGEPGSIKDRALMLTRPRDVLRGLVLAARAVGAREAVVYLKGSFAAPEDALRTAIAGPHDDPLLAAIGDELAVEVRRGDDSYVGGEETAAIEVLEGKRPWPRPKPPPPAAVGFQGRPTLVQNVETLARAVEAVADPAGFRARESTLVSLWGDVRAPGVHEVALGTPLRQIIDVHGKGATDGVGMLFPAGPSAAPLAAGQLDVPLDPDALRAAGSGLGTASLLVVGSSACPLEIAVSLARFFERESCGQCPPCTLGTASLARLLASAAAARARAKDMADLEEVAGFMGVHGYCAHSRTAAGTLTGLLRRFPAEVGEHLAHGGCPRPGPPRDPFAAGSPELRAIEAVVDELAKEPRPVR